MVKQSCSSTRSTSAMVTPASAKALPTAAFPAISSCMLGRTSMGSRSTVCPRPAISTTRPRPRTSSLADSTSAAAPSEIREQSCSRRGSATIGLEPRPSAGRARIASGENSPIRAGGPSGPKWARGLAAPFL